MNHFYSLRYTGWPPIPNSEYNNPDSGHWETQAQLAQRRLNDLLGDDDYRLWVEIVWPGEVIQTQTWKQIFDTAQWALDHPEAVSQQLECSCRPDAEIATCPVCQANARIREGRE